jgi:hypothetical protein
MAAAACFHDPLVGRERRAFDLDPRQRLPERRDCMLHGWAFKTRFSGFGHPVRIFPTGFAHAACGHERMP